MGQRGMAHQELKPKNLEQLNGKLSFQSKDAAKKISIVISSLNFKRK